MFFYRKLAEFYAIYTQAKKKEATVTDCPIFFPL